MFRQNLFVYVPISEKEKTFYLTMFRQNLVYLLFIIRGRVPFYLTMFRQNDLSIPNVNEEKNAFYLTMFRQNSTIEALYLLAKESFLSHNVQTKLGKNLKNTQL